MGSDQKDHGVLLRKVVPFDFAEVVEQIEKSTSEKKVIQKGSFMDTGHKFSCVVFQNFPGSE